jgi:hypothetical protein
MSTVNAYTLESWISSFRGETNVVSDFVFKLALSDGENVAYFCDETVLSKYSVELAEHLTSVDLTDREQQFYAYNPRLFAYDLYGAPELWYLILYANEMHSATQFKVARVKFYKKSVIKVLNSIRVLESARKDDNEQEMTDIVVGKQQCNNDINVSII